MAKYDGFIGLVAILLAAYLFSTNRKAIQLRILVWGVLLQFAFAYIVLKTQIGFVFYKISLFVNALLGYAGEGSRFVFGTVLSHLCLSGSAHHHLHLLALRHSVLPGRDADFRQRHGRVHAEIHGHQRRGIHLRGGQHCHGTNRSASHHSPLPCDAH
jgi:hypothetical protein